jgi:hypothetical protein
MRKKKKDGYPYRMMTAWIASLFIAMAALQLAGWAHAPVVKHPGASSSSQ